MSGLQETEDWVAGWLERQVRRVRDAGCRIPDAGCGREVRNGVGDERADRGVPAGDSGRVVVREGPAGPGTAVVEGMTAMVDPESSSG
jgi:hypothetical protein